MVVPVGALRKQTVTVEFGRKDDEGHDLISMASICGPVSGKNAMALLRYNTKMVHGAFAVQATPSGEMIVVQANQLADTADAAGPDPRADRRRLASGQGGRETRRQRPVLAGTRGAAALGRTHP